MLDRLVIYLLSACIAIAPSIADASQNALMSPTTGTVSGLQLTNNYNNALDSLNTCNSGASAPVNQLSGTPSLGNCWLNSTASPYPWNYYDGANWVPIGSLDAANHIFDLQMGGGVGMVASASTTDLCASLPQNRIAITGATTITSFGSTCAPGIVKIVTFAASPLLTYNAASLIIPGSANVTPSAGDQAVLQALGGGNWQVVSYTPANGQALVNPAIDVGAIEWTFSPNIPSGKYLWAYGQAVSRTTYSVLQSALTITQSVSSTNGSPTLTGFTDTTQIPVGAKIEASFLASPTTISSCTATTCTMGANANATTTANVAIFPYGDGDGSTTFNLPDCRGATFAGRDNMGGTARGTLTSSYYGTSPDALGAAGGGQNVTIAKSGLPNFAPGFTGSAGTAQSQADGYFDYSNTSPSATGVAGPGAVTTIQFPGGTSPNYGYVVSNFTPQGTVASINGGVTQQPTSVVQPTITANCMIRVLAMLVPPNLSSLPSFAANDNEAAIIERRFAA